MSAFVLLWFTPWAPSRFRWSARRRWRFRSHWCPTPILPPSLRCPIRRSACRIGRLPPPRSWWPGPTSVWYAFWCASKGGPNAWTFCCIQDTGTVSHPCAFSGVAATRRIGWIFSRRKSNYKQRVFLRCATVNEHEDETSSRKPYCTLGCDKCVASCGVSRRGFWNESHY